MDEFLVLPEGTVPRQAKHVDVITDQHDVANLNYYCHSLLQISSQGAHNNIIWNNFGSFGNHMFSDFSCSTW